MKEYQTPIAETIVFLSKDVITESIWKNIGHSSGVSGGYENLNQQVEVESYYDLNEYDHVGLNEFGEVDF